jgi:hypothetical protein
MAWSRAGRQPCRQSGVSPHEEDDRRDCCDQEGPGTY